jgi:hypothetical protein
VDWQDLPWHLIRYQHAAAVRSWLADHRSRQLRRRPDRPLAAAAPSVADVETWAQGYPWLGMTRGWMLVSVVLLLTTIPIVPLVFLPRGRVFGTEMEAARAAGTVTPGLRPRSATAPWPRHAITK